MMLIYAAFWLTIAIAFILGLTAVWKIRKLLRQHRPVRQEREECTGPRLYQP